MEHLQGPFSSFKFSILAVEIVEHILLFLDRPKDLLALALTSNRARDIIIPIHLQTRLIRCDIRRISLWKALASSPLLASRFVSLHIVDEPYRSPSVSCSDLHRQAIILPSFLLDSASLVADAIDRYFTQERISTVLAGLIAIIPFMPSLTSFHWAYDGADASPSLVATLRDSCPNLSDLHLRFGRRQSADFSSHDYDSLWNFPSLSRFFLDAGANIPLGTTQYQAIAEMLVERCPLLESLHLRNGAPMARTIFTRGRWHNLKAFSIAGTSLYAPYYPQGSFAQAFIDAHPKLESIDIASFSKHFSITYGPLRQLTLRSVDVQVKPGSDITKHLEYLSICVVRFDGFLKTPLSSLPALRFLVIHAQVLPPGLRYIEKCLWHVTKLHLTSPFKKYSIRRADIETQQTINNQRGWINSLIRGKKSGGVRNFLMQVFENEYKFIRNMKHLTHLGGFFAVLWDDVQRCNHIVDAMTKQIADACPTLRFVELFSCRERWVTINRNKDGSYAGWQWTGDLPGVRVDNWTGHMGS